MDGKNQAITTIVIGVIIVAVLIWIGISRRQMAEPTPAETGQPAVTEVPPLKVGWMGPLTGDAAPYGDSIKKGVELAKKDLGADFVELIFEDSKCEPVDAVSAVNKLISTDQVKAIIGEVCSGATLAAAPIAQQNQVVMISASSTSPAITDAGDYIFRTIPSDALQGNFGANLVFQDGHTKLAILYSNEEYGLGFTNVLRDSFSKLGGQVVASETFERGVVDMRTQLTKIKGAAPDAIYIISNSPDSAVAALRQIKELNIAAALYGSEGLKSPDVVTGAGSAAEGLLVTSVSSGTAEFRAKFRQEYGEDPGPFSAQGYDALVALIRAAEQAAATDLAIKDALAGVEFEGASGYIKFDASGDIAGNYDVLEVKDSQFVPVKTEEPQA